MADRLVVLKKPGNAGGGKEPQFKTDARKRRGTGDWETWQLRAVQKLQTALHAKAKAEPEFRFYALYDKMYRADVLAHAYACCKANKGAAGVDGQTFEDIEAYGEERWLGELAQGLKEERYRPQAVRRVYIPKPNGKLRPLGIPLSRIECARRRRCWCSSRSSRPICRRSSTPIGGQKRTGCSQGSPQPAEHRAPRSRRRGFVGYFDSIPHAELMKSVARRIVDRHVLHLIKMWLEAPVEETDERGRKTRRTRNRDSGRGTPQGSPISPLLANLYMRRFILGWKQLGFEQRFGANIVQLCR